MASHHSSVEANKERFNKSFADEYDKFDTTQGLGLVFALRLLTIDPLKARITEEQSEKLIGDPHQPVLGFTKENTLPAVSTFAQDYPNSAFKPGSNVIDFACGTGLVTENLAPYIANGGSIVGLDISKEFLQKFDEKGKAVGEQYDVSMKSEVVDILQPETDTSKYVGWSDVIVCTMAYHHLHNYEEITAKLVTFLKPGGWLYIFDFYNEDVENTVAATSSDPAISHMGGLKIESLNKTLSDGGLVNVSTAREVRVNIWQMSRFISSHLPQKVVDLLHENKLEQHPENPDLYYVPASLILAMGQKP